MRLALALAALLGPLALAQTGPFGEHAEALAAAHGLERLELRLQALALSEDRAAFAEEIEAALTRDLPRFRASLTLQDETLAAELGTALENLADRLETGAEAEAALQGALELSARARPLVVSASLMENDAFTAALTALLLLAEEGVAERFEAAAEGEVAAYAVGWATQRRVEALWAGLEPASSDTVRFEVNDMLSELRELFPSPELPDPLLLIDPEAAEDPAQRTVGFLEALAGASLYPDRDLGALLDLVGDLVATGCAEDGRAGEQRLAVAGFYYAQYLGNTVAMLAPDSHARLEPLWAVYAEAEEAEDSEAEDNEAREDAPLGCSTLTESLTEIGRVFGR